MTLQFASFKLTTIRAIVIATILLCIAMPAFADSITPPKEKLRIGIVESYKPLSFRDESGDIVGMDVDVINLVMKEMGYTTDDYVFVVASRNKLIASLKVDDVDLIAGLNRFKYLENDISFGSSILSLNLNIISRNNENYQTLNDIRGKTIILKKDTDAHRFLLEQKITNKFIFQNTIEGCLKTLMSGKGDAVLGNHVMAKYAISKLQLSNISSVVSDAAQIPHCVAVSKNNPQLLAELEKALKAVKSSEAYYKIYQKWDSSSAVKESMTIYIIVFGGSSVLVLLLLLFIWLLRRKVSNATYKVKTTQQEFELAIQAGRIIVWTYDIKMRLFVTYKNAGSATQLSIDDFKEKIHPDDSQNALHTLNNISLNRVEKSTIIFRADFKNGEEYRTYESTMVLSEMHDNKVERIVGTLKDITDEVSIQQILKDFKMKTNFITTASGIVLFNYDIADGRFTQLNDTDGAVLISYDYDAYMAMVHEDDIDKAQEFIDLMQLGTSSYISTEYRMIGINKKYEWYSIEAMAYQDDSGTEIITKYLGLRRNNTKWKNITDDLIELRDKAEVANKLKSAFLANMSHEIRTPLNAIVGFSELITDCDDDEQKEHYKSIIKANNELLLQLINDVLDLSKIEAGFADFKFTYFEFSSFFDSLYQTLKLRQNNTVELKCNAPEGELEVFGDKNRINQIVTNFVTNALKFTSKGSITLGYTYDDTNLKISVTDTGIGISEEGQSKIFDRFEKLNQFAQGTGLGLSICRSLAEAMNGSVGVESKEGEGSTFWMILPYKNTASSGVPEVVETKKISREAKPSSLRYSTNEKKTLLIAEDMDNNYILASRLLDDEYTIIRAHNGREAVDLTLKHNPDFILMDIKMPVMDGLTATKKIREFNKDVPIIALTAYVYDTNQEEAALSGCNAFLSKPYRKTQLRETLKNVDTGLTPTED